MQLNIPGSSAMAHLADADQNGILDMAWWKRERSDELE